MTSRYGPVSDWATDLDHADPEYDPDAHQTWSDLRQAGCPIVMIGPGHRSSRRELPIRVPATA